MITGIKVQEVVDGGPLTAATVRVSTGMVIEAIDQTPIASGADTPRQRTVNFGASII